MACVSIAVKSPFLVELVNFEKSLLHLSEPNFALSCEASDDGRILAPLLAGEAQAHGRNKVPLRSSEPAWGSFFSFRYRALHYVNFELWTELLRIIRHYDVAGYRIFPHF